MKIDKLMSRPVRACAPTDTLATAARLMWEGDCGILPVIDVEGRPVGVVTDRDVCMSAFFSGTSLSEMPVARAMSRDLVTVCSSDPVHQALDVMRARQLRRLPVVDEEGLLVGMVSLADLATLRSRVLDEDDREVRPDDVALVLAGICRPRGQEPSAVMVVEIVPEGAPAPLPKGRTAKPRAARKPRETKGSRTRSKSKKA